VFSANPYSTVAFSTARVLLPPIDGVVSEAGEVADTTSALAVFIGQSLEAGDAVDVSEVASAVFSAAVNEAVDNLETTTALFTASVFVSEGASGVAEPYVEPSVYNPAVLEAVYAAALVNAGGVFTSQVVASASVVEQLYARYLWENIDDAQTVSWAAINTNSSPGWGSISTTSGTQWQKIDTQD